MAETLKKYYSVSEVAKIYGFTTATVREMCWARGSKFAFRKTPRGKFYIDIRRFREYIDRKRREG